MVSSGLVNRVDVSHFRLSIHLLIAFLILSLIFWNYLKIKNNQKNFNGIGTFIPLLFLILIFVQLILGAFVSGMDAGKIYNSWPLMGNTFFPNDNNLIDLFKLSAFSDPSLVQFMHRNLAYIITIFFIFILFKIYKNRVFYLYRSVNILGLLITLQIILGIFTVIYGAQIYIAAMHQLSSIFLVSSSLYFLYKNTKIN
jgi:cytochrome c oxidase assembly protein subunit 15